MEEESVIDKISNELKEAYRKAHPKSDSERQKESKWLSDRETLEKHISKWKRNSKGYLIKDTYEGCVEKRVTQENSDRFVEEENEKKEKSTAKIFTRKGQAEHFIKNNPIFFDNSGVFWKWDSNKFCYKIIDETDILNEISKEMEIDTINSKARTEILNSLKQVGRLNIPKPIKPTWIQFQDIIYDISSGESFNASPEYFVTNPIPYKASSNSDTSNMDKIFEQWVGKDYVNTLYEIIAYCLIPDYPIHRLFCFVGSGLNGKSCFLNLLKKFIGVENCTSTELDTLLNSRFEITKLHKKLVCTMGETDFSEMTKTSIIKRLTGGDLIGFEYKNKTPFDDKNYAKILIATNNLPSTNDKSIGFYRRWLIIDFPNQFTEAKDILESIPEEEYNNLAIKCVIYLNSLLTKREFTNEGSIEERTKRFEDRSNPLDKFLKEFCYIDNPDEFIFKYDFEKKLNQWCKENRFRSFSDVVIGKELKERGFISLPRTAFWMNEGKGGQLRAWIGLKWK